MESKENARSSICSVCDLLALKESTHCRYPTHRQSIQGKISRNKDGYFDGLKAASNTKHMNVCARVFAMLICQYDD